MSLETKDKLPDRFRDNAAIVSGILKQAALGPGIYIRRENGEVKQANYSDRLTHENMSGIFTDYKKENLLSVKFKTSLEWPNIDFVYDAQLQAVFADGGRYVLKFIDEQRDKGDLYLYYNLHEGNSEYQITGYLDYLKTKDGGKDRVINFGIDCIQKLPIASKAELSKDEYFKLVSISIIGMPLIFSEWPTSGQDVNLGKMPAMTAIISTTAKNHSLGIKGEHPSVYTLYMDASSIVASGLRDA